MERWAESRIRPEVVYAWRGPSLLITDNRGECGEGETLSGYYFREARHLRTLRLEIDGEPPWPCEVGSGAQEEILLVFVHPEMREFGGGGSGQSGDEIRRDPRGIPYRALDLRLSCRVGAASLEVSLEIANRSREEVAFELAWTLGADFADLQEAHAGRREQEAEVHTETGEGAVHFRYGHPDLPLETRVLASGGSSWSAEAGRLATTLRLASGQIERLGLRVEPVDPQQPLTADEAARREEHLRRWVDGLVRIETPGNPVAGRVVDHNVSDLASFPLLEGVGDEWLAPQAGMPLYPAFFGRDALTAGWQSAFLDQGRSLGATLVKLGRLQSDRFFDWRDEEPGRIPYQVRGGPLARLGLNPFAAYYADFASPLMFVISLAHLYAWTGDKKDLERHWDTARRILDWAREHGDRDGDGYLEYLTKSPHGTKNQGWKDSGDAMVYEDGRTVPAPIGTCELQGYWFAAQQLMGFLAWSLGHRDEARAHWRSAADLKERFNRDWWMEEEGFLALALDPDKRPVRSLGSNAGHCLAAGIVADEHVLPLAGRLFAPDLFSGWGVRTLSSGHPSYSPLSYHLGSVWAVENATVVLGLRRYGLDVRAAELARALFDLAELYPGHRIPECIGGYNRWENRLPGAYPRANTPQTWNASAFPLLLHALLGLQPVAPFDLLVVDPALPAWLPEVILKGLRLGGATATLRFWRDEAGASHAEVLEQRGTLHLVRQPPPESLTAGVFDRLKALADGVLHR
ncbi:MAG TPA: glycogen debranching N-terminal domain-containing protein [Thermoanaerobaculia bacterium]|jgi:glycogen debranching enzyme|nr:glycogen debranching N-terminal domain-containing protein [Thermoanaerobaculia bacterium]